MERFNVCVFFLAGLLSAGSFISCTTDKDQERGTLSLHLTDAPTDAENVSGVFVTITALEYQKEGRSWEMFEKFSGPLRVNLLDLTEGKTTLLGDFEIEEGRYTGLRFKLDAPENGGNASGEATYLEFTDGSRQPLYVPSGTKSGYKAMGDFTVPVNGFVAITADFDVRKSVVEAGKSGKYLLKPVLRIIVNNQAGTIAGTINEFEPDAGHSYVVYAYEAGTYSEEELAEPAEGEVRFLNSISSAEVKEDGSFVLPFLAAGSYDLVFTSSVNGEFQEVVKVMPNVAEVQSLKTAEVEVFF